MIFTFSCTQKFKEKLKRMPQMPINSLTEQVSKGSPDFQDGWRAGCEVGMSAGGNTFYKTLYKSNAVDGYRILNSTDYNRAYSTAFWYCYRSIDIRQASSIWGSYFTGFR